jgi:hypothetical protein
VKWSWLTETLSNSEKVQTMTDAADAIYTIRIMQKERSVAPSSGARNKQDKKINLKEMFAPINLPPEESKQEKDPLVFEKKIRVSEMK